MNNTLKNILIFLSGAACGAAGMWFGVRTYYQSVSDKEIEEMKDYIEKTYRSGSHKQNEEKARAVIDKKKRSEYNAEKTMLNSYKESIQKKTSYNNVEKPEEDHPEEDEHRDPYIIAEEEWSDPEPYYEKITLLYDKGDKSFVDYATEELIPNPGDILGLNVLEIIDKVNTGTYLYVRDDKMSKDYEIEITDVGEDDDEAVS